MNFKNFQDRLEQTKDNFLYKWKDQLFAKKDRYKNLLFRTRGPLELTLSRQSVS